jgi:hypothetical protein
MLEELLAAVVDDPNLNTRERLVTMVKEVHRELGVGSGEHGTSSRGQ